MKSDPGSPRTLAIISDTPMSFDADGKFMAFEPTLREIEHLTGTFDHIVWYGMPFYGKASGAYRSPQSEKIQLHSFFHAVGGESIIEKMRLIPRVPVLIFQVFMLVRKYHFIHTRGPSLPAWIAIWFAKVFPKKKFWHKYAGNWNEAYPPYSYKAQRSLLRKSAHPVTVNGKWDEKNPRILPLENPCFSEKELEVANRTIKRFDTIDKEIVFAGRLEKEKGVFAVLQAASQLHKALTWHIIGAGKDEMMVKEIGSQLKNVIIHGGVSRNDLNQIYERSHFLVLPTMASEGFPKVIAEACGFGCIPIVSDVSSIRQYVTDEFGCILADVTGEGVATAVNLLESDSTLSLRSYKAKQMSSLFSYERYAHRVSEEVFGLATSIDSQ